MSIQAGLKDRARFDAFSREWREDALKEAQKWCNDRRAQELLADAVLAEFQKKYADSPPPLNMDYQIRAQVCLVYSLTGNNVRKLKNYIADHSLSPEAVESPGPQPRPEAQQQPERRVEPPVSEAVSEPPVSEAVSEPPAPVTEAVPEPPAPVTEAVPEPSAPVPTPVSAPEPAPAPKPAPQAKTEAQPPTPAAPEKAAPQKSKVRPDTFLDPIRTSYWTPNEERSGHIIAEVELPDEDVEERSPIISFINLVLFLITIGAFGFCFYETGFLQYLLQ